MEGLGPEQSLEGEWMGPAVGTVVPCGHTHGDLDTGFERRMRGTISYGSQR